MNDTGTSTSEPEGTNSIGKILNRMRPEDRPKNFRPDRGGTYFWRGQQYDNYQEFMAACRADPEPNWPPPEDQ